MVVADDRTSRRGRGLNGGEFPVFAPVDDAFAKIDPATIEALAQATDFIALGEEIWSTDDPAAALTRLTAPFRN